MSRTFTSCGLSSITLNVITYKLTSFPPEFFLFQSTIYGDSLFAENQNIKDSFNKSIKYFSLYCRETFSKDLLCFSRLHKNFTLILIYIPHASSSNQFKLKNNWLINCSGWSSNNLQGNRGWGQLTSKQSPLPLEQTPACNPVSCWQADWQQPRVIHARLSWNANVAFKPNVEYTLELSIKFVLRHVLHTKLNELGSIFWIFFGKRPF